jgi:hypothetical protein
MEIAQTLQIFGSMLGFAAFFWRIYDEGGNYLRISLTLDDPKDGMVLARTTVDNRHIFPKDLTYAILLVGPESEDLRESARIVAKKCEYDGSINYSNDLELFRIDAPQYEGGRALIQLKYYYSENIAIGDEILTYSAPINLESFEKGIHYSVRFFIFGKNRLHRSVQNCFRNPESPKTTDLLETK